MNQNLKTAFVAAAFCGLLGYAFWSAGPTSAKPRQKNSESSGAQITPSLKEPESQAKSAPSTLLPLFQSSQPAVADALDPIGKQRVFEVIEMAKISYDPMELPRIKPYLTHPDPEIREAALNGMVVLGHADGAPLLREAARSLTDTKERVRFLEKADWLELPSATPEAFKNRPRKGLPLPQSVGDDTLNPVE